MLKLWLKEHKSKYSHISEAAAAAEVYESKSIH